MSSVAEGLGVSPSTIQYHVAKAGVRTRGWGKLDVDDLLIVERRACRGDSYAAIARDLGIHRSTVRYHAKRAGAENRRRRYDARACGLAVRLYAEGGGYWRHRGPDRDPGGLCEHGRTACWATPRQVVRALKDRERRAIAAAYRSGDGTIHELAERFGRGESTVGKIIEAAGARREPWQCARSYEIWDGALDELTDEAAYWVGFLMADGCVMGNRVSVALHRRDREHLEELRSFLRATNPIYEETRRRYAVRLCVHSPSPGRGAP